MVDFEEVVRRARRTLHQLASVVHQEGHNDDIDTAADEDLWENGGNFVPPTEARIHDLVSTSAADAAAGTGAQTIEIHFLDTDNAEADETVTMNGLTNVPMLTAATFILNMHIETTGSGNENAGVITATAQTDGTVSNSMAIGDNESLSAIYKVPAGRLLYLTSWHAALTRASGTGNMDVFLNEQEPGEPIHIHDTEGLFAGGSSRFTLKFDPAEEFPALTIIKMRMSAGSNNMGISGGFSGYLIDALGTI